MPIDAYSSLLVQIVLFALLAPVLIISAVSLFIKPAKRTIRASLVEASTGHIIDISQSETSIGRSKSCDISIQDASVSRFHAVLSKRKSDWMIFDTNSAHGVTVNGKKIEKKILLKDGDSVIFGQKEYIFYSTAVTTRRKLFPKETGSGQTARRKPPQTGKRQSNDERPDYVDRKNTGKKKSTAKQKQNDEKPAYVDRKNTVKRTNNRK